MKKMMMMIRRFFMVLGVILISSWTCSGIPTMVLEKMDFNMGHTEMVARDRARHHLMFQKSSSMQHGIANFSVNGSSDLYLYGFYFAKVKLGNPPKEYQLLIDTASGVTWVNCNPCIGCPHNSTIISLRDFDPHSSSSAEPISCTSSSCTSLPYSTCSSDRCGYYISYGDGTEVSGYYVRDTFHFDTVMGNNATASTTSTNVLFGCTNKQSGSLTRPNTVDGILALAPGDMTFISQLDSQGIVPNVFSHCFNGESKGGGGILVLGEIIEPSIIYSPLVPEQTRYNLNLLSISIRGKIVPIDANVFSTSMNREGTIVDSGTTYAYLPEEAFDPFITALVDAVPPSVAHSFTDEEGHCFQVSNSVRDLFPLVSLNFEGDASMVLKVEEYLVQQHYNATQWCVGFKKSQGPTILGDLVLKDKIIVYDLALQRIGWADYDCSLSVNISLAPPRASCSSRDATLHQFLTGSLYFILIFVGLLFV